MDTVGGLAAVGRHAETGAALVMWAVTVLRLPGVLRRPEHRPLWLAVAAAAVAYSFDLSLVAESCAAIAGAWTRLIGDLFGLLAATAILRFSATVAGARRLIPALWVLMSAAAVVLVALDVLVLPHGAGAEIYDDRGLSGGAVYLVVLAGAHLAAGSCCALLCWTHGRRDARGALRVSLLTFGAGAVLLCLGWIADLLYFLTRFRPLHELSPLLVGLGGAGYAVATQVPFADRLARATRKLRALWRLSPLWSRLVSAVPEVTMAPSTSRAGGWAYFAGEPGLGVHRMLVESQDALLALRGYVSARAVAAAAAVAAGTANPRVSQTACWLRVALRAERSGDPPGVVHMKPAVHALSGDLADEVAFFTALARTIDARAAVEFENRWEEPVLSDCAA
ncbi:MAB_1171c family putative transporter [Nocardia sp. SSK8]|uniref:MAB_1171c family putative transporter n=1 Tax=Nocardia sp. SSK8 TaxID=3120154 RepID=UPI00300AA373